MLAISAVHPYILLNAQRARTMKKKLTLILIIASLFLIFDSMNIGHALVMLFLAGVVPGTNIIIDAGRMLEFFTLLIGFTLSRITLYVIRLGVSSNTKQLTYQSL